MKPDFIPHHLKMVSLIFVISPPFGKDQEFFRFTLIIVVLYLITIHYQNRKILILQATPFTFLFSMYTLSNAKWNLKFQ